MNFWLGVPAHIMTNAYAASESIRLDHIDDSTVAKNDNPVADLDALTIKVIFFRRRLIGPAAEPLGILIGSVLQDPGQGCLPNSRKEESMAFGWLENWHSCSNSEHKCIAARAFKFALQVHPHHGIG